MIGLVHLSIGVCLFNPEFGLQNFEVAAQHFHSALEKGWTQAYYYLGSLYRHGLGVKRCDMTAVNFFQLGTNAGDPGSISQLGNCCSQGIGVEQDPEKAAQLVRRGAAKTRFYRHRTARLVQLVWS